MRVLFLILCMLMACQVQAHQMKAAITRVLFNERSGNVEIMHRFYVHDAEHALDTITGESAYLLENPEAQLQFARYVSAHFAMGIGEPKPVTLSHVGQEVDGKFIWVYQEMPLPEQVAKLWFRFDALQEHWPEQVNQINVEGLGPVRSLQFDKRSRWQQLSF